MPITQLAGRVTLRAHLIARAFRLVWACAPGWTAASLGLVAAQGLLPLASLYLLKVLVDAIAAAFAGAGAGPGAAGASGVAGASGAVAAVPAAAPPGFPWGTPGSAEQVLLVLALAGGVAVLEVVARSLAAFVAEAQTETVTDHLSDVIHRKSAALDLAYFEDPHYHDMLHRAQEEAGWRPTYLVNALLQAGQASLSLVALAGLLLSLNWAVGLVLFVASLPAAALRVRYAGRLYLWRRRTTGDARLAWYLHSLLTDAQYAKELRMLDLAPTLAGRFREVRSRLRRERLAISRSRSAADSVAQGGATLAIFGTYATLALVTLRGGLTVGGFVLYYQAFQRGQSWLRDALNHLASLYEGSLFLADLFDFLDLEAAGSGRPADGGGPGAPGGTRGPLAADHLPPAAGVRVHAATPAIVFDRVSFVYPGSARKALDEVSFEVGAGEHVALAGENGSGKTTVVKLLCGLHRPTAGTVLVEGVDLREWDPAELRRRIAVMFQDYARYQLTARENIGFGDLAALAGEAEGTHEARVHEAAALAGADRVVEALPRGYDTRLGRWFEEGVELSTGDWQRVALARAFLRDAPIVVLDEPTSSLDAKVEHEVFGRLRLLARHRTAVFISHRMSTARLADRIFVLASGRVVEQGSHEDLEARGGTYATLFRLQAESYR